MEQVILAFESEKNGLRIREMLTASGVAECYLCRTAAEVKRLVSQQGLNAVVCGYKLPDETAEGLFEDLPPHCSMLVVAVQGMLDLIGSDELLKLPAPATRENLLAAVRNLLLSSRRADRFVRPQRSAEELALIERAKEALMARRGISEEEAHRYLQKRSMDEGKKLTQTAQAVLDGNA